MRRLGAILSPYIHPPEDLRELALAAEAAGVPEVWIWEDCFRQSAYAVAGAALAFTERLRVGIGIAPLPLRNVAATAMEIATLERMFPGRLLPGLGHGVQSWMAQVGARPASPLTLMNEQLPALRRLLAGERVSTEGRYVRLRDVALDWPPAVAPRVYSAAEGPKTLRLAGAVADGVVLDSKHTPDEIAAAVAAVREGRREAGRDGDPDVVAYVVTAFGPDAAAHADAAVGNATFGPPVSGDGADASRRALAGTVEEVAAQAEEFYAAGVDDLILLPTPDAATRDFLVAAGEVARRLGADR
jgi:alkanesulfonate monooxygenase SsuD/methylene tetrahydromethanopterin reductase-like flavin-dependent oxidoreductase (luciferase family)